jgi:5'-3' exonuclease
MNKSKSETSYGARIGNAEKLVAALQNFNAYQPIRPEYGISSYTDLINATKLQNTTVAGKKQSYSLAVDNRKQIFETGSMAINKILSPINGTVKGSYGRTSKEANDVAGIIAKIRGANIKKSAKPDEEAVSQSYQSYSSKAQFFSDLIVNLTNFGTNYEPVNDDLKIIGLNEIYTNAIAANSLVMATFSQFAQQNTSRIDSYYQLSQSATRIKDSIKAQYGNHSTEYQLIKGLNI